MSYARIAGTGSYLPEKTMTNADLEKMVDTTDEWIRARTGIEERHVAADGEYTVDLAEKAAIKAMEAAGKTKDDIDLIIVDNISTLCRSGKENEAEGWIPIQEWALQQRAQGRSVLFIHHSGKDGRQRGTSKREDVLDTVISLRQPSDYTQEQGARFEVRFEKARGFYGEDAEPIEAQLITDEHGIQRWTHKPLEDVIHEQIISLYKEGLSQKEIVQEIERNKSTVSRHIKRAKAEGCIR